VLHEDKKYYPSAEETYGPGVETLVQEEDTMHLSEPIIAPIKEIVFQQTEPRPDGETGRTCTDEFMCGLMQAPGRVRNLAVVGHLHAGKTSLVDLLVMATHYGKYPSRKDDRKGLGYMDNLLLEQDRKISLKAKAMAVVVPDSRGTSWLLNVMDTPGHSDFVDEVEAGLRISDGVLLVVDAVEGVTATVEAHIRRAVALQLPLVLVINKVERLIVELRLPPTDAYYKLRHTVEEVNTVVGATGAGEGLTVSPERGNVFFASTTAGWLFSLGSFAEQYALRSALRIDAAGLARRLWGDVYHEAEGGAFRRGPSQAAPKRTFVTFVLEPLYKLYMQVLGEETAVLRETLRSLGITSLKEGDIDALNTRPLLGLVMQKFLGASVSALVDAVRDVVPSPAAKSGLCNPSAPQAVAYATKCYPRQQAGIPFDVLVRVYRGSLAVGAGVAVHSEKAEEAPVSCTVTGLAIPCGRYAIPVSTVPAGSWALVSGVDSAVAKTGVIATPGARPADLPLPRFSAPKALVKLAIEPVSPSDLPRVLEGLRKLGRAYPALQTKVEESGEHLLLGTGELYLDCALHDLRRIYASVDVKLSDPTVCLAETVLETSFLKCYAETPNQRSKLTMIAEPLERGLAESIEAGQFAAALAEQQQPRRGLSGRLQSEFGWDILAARSLWAFGPSPTHGPNALLDDCLPGEVDKDALLGVRDALQQGFQWAVREGPLCEEPVRGTKLRILDALVAAEPVYRGAGQVIPTTRRVCHAALLTAAPRLMEPVSLVEIYTPKDCTEVVYQVLAKRRGHVTSETPKAGSPLYTIRALLPVLDSFGFETDLRVATLGAAFCQQHFDHWQVVPGDPLDKNIRLVPLEPSPAPHLARDLLLKTRRRKGLAEDVSLAKFFDDPMLLELAKEQATLGIGSLSL
jgi:U5 small nuclear ribonucleoprotein component